MKTKIFQFIFLILIISSCINDENENENVTINKLAGYVQKGPFLNGTSITISELTNDLVPTGKTYPSQIIDNRGTFEIRYLELASSLAELKATGFYFNEALNKNSDAQLTLYALSDLSDKTTVNVNIISTLEKTRVEYLTSNGSNFNDAKKQAQAEILKIFEIEKSDMSESENLDISQKSEDNAILLAISLILQGYLNTADVSELIANIGTDIRIDGVLNSDAIGSSLINNARILKCDEIKKNIESKYKAMGFDIAVPDFKKYVDDFIDKTDFVSTNQISYPVFYESRLNVLCDSSFIVKGGKIYGIAAYLPGGNTVKIVCKPTSGYGWGAAGFSIMESEGYTVRNNYPEDLTLTATGTNQTVNLPVMFGGDSTAISYTSIDFFIYENNSAGFTRMKTVKTFQ